MDNIPTPTQELVFGWWNTGISHRKQTPEKHDEKIKLAIEVVKALSVKVDFLALGEVNDGDMAQINNPAFKLGYTTINGTDKAGKSHFDLGILYHREKIEFIDKNFFNARWAETETLRIAMRIDIKPNAGDKPFFIFASHWPSDLTVFAPEAKREDLGRELRRHVNETNNFYTIVMGDYNAEPFSQALTLNLWATPDRGLLLKKKSYLYNPFWKHLGEASVCGTYFLENDPFYRWKIIDQIMFSSNFITSREWFLDEKRSLIWAEEPLKSLKENEIDHFPVISAVVYKGDL